MASEDADWEQAQAIANLSLDGTTDGTATRSNVEKKGAGTAATVTAPIPPHVSPATAAAIGVSTGDVIDPALIEGIDNPRERMNVLKFEDTIIRFMNTVGKVDLHFAPMNNYHRLIVHRLAKRFMLEHQAIETPGLPAGNQMRPLVLLKTSASRVPRVLLIEMAPPEEKTEDATVSPAAPSGRKIQLMKRDVNAPKGNQKANRSGKQKQMTHAEKEKAYQEARARIFGRSSPNGEDAEASPQAPRRSNSPQLGTKGSKSMGKAVTASGPDGGPGFGRGKGRGRGGVQAGAGDAPGGLSDAKVQGRGQGSGEEGADEAGGSTSPGYSEPSRSKGPEVVDAGEWLREGRVKAREKGRNEVDPDFVRNYDAYRPTFAPYRESQVGPIGSGPSSSGRGMGMIPMGQQSMNHHQPPLAQPMGQSGMSHSMNPGLPPSQSGAMGHRSQPPQAQWSGGVTGGAGGQYLPVQPGHGYYSQAQDHYYGGQPPPPSAPGQQDYYRAFGQAQGQSGGPSHVQVQGRGSGNANFSMPLPPSDHHYSPHRTEGMQQQQQHQAILQQQQQQHDQQLRQQQYRQQLHHQQLMLQQQQGQGQRQGQG
ncbi:unnamed protein product [Chrysoparadoxa australica]